MAASIMERPGVPYTVDAPRRCQFITDDTRFSVRMCGEPPAWAGCSWCSAHLAVVSPRAAAQMHRARAA